MSNRIILLAHNIRSLWNVGSLFRTSDAFQVEKIYLTGYTATPPRREISKTAIGAEEYVAWEYEKDPKNIISVLKKDKWEVVGLEQAENSIGLFQFEPSDRTLLIIGHEVTGISEDLLQLCDKVVEIPMYGKKESINVAVATGIILNHMRR